MLGIYCCDLAITAERICPFHLSGCAALRLKYLGLRERTTFDEPNFETSFYLGSADGKSVSKGDERTASLQIGDIFRSELVLD